MNVEETSELNSEIDKSSLKEWTNEEVSALVRLWSEFHEELQDGQMAERIHEQLADQLQQKLKRKDAFTQQDVQNKMHTLKREYM